MNFSYVLQAGLKETIVLSPSDMMCIFFAKEIKGLYSAYSCWDGISQNDLFQLLSNMRYF